MRRKQRDFGSKKIGKGEAKFLAQLYAAPAAKIVPDETKENFFEELEKVEALCPSKS